MLKAAIPLLLGLFLVGICRREEVWILIVLFILWRWLALFAEWRRSGEKEPDWSLRERELKDRVEQYWRLSGEHQQLEAPAVAPSVQGAAPSPLEIAKGVAAQVQRERAAWIAPRPVWDLIAECVGLAGYLIILPITLFLWRDDFFSFRRYSSWMDISVLLGSALLYGAPHWRSFRQSSWTLLRRMWWWAPALVLVLITPQLVSEKHPYLNPFQPDRQRLAAEKIMSLRDNILAESHADWLTDYAQALASKGEKAEAIRVCEHALRLRPGMPQAERLLAQLGASPIPSKPLIAPDAPYFPSDSALPSATRTAIGPGLETVSGCTLVLISMGNLSDDVMDYVAAVLHRECGISVLVYERAIPLPEHTRRRGLIGGAQWSYESLVNALQQELGNRWPRAPIRYLVLTSADLYLGDANFVFSGSAEWGGIVAAGQFLNADKEAGLLKHRLAKQSLSALIKSVGVAPSGDRRCVTSYPANVRELDEKGNRPLPSTLEAFQNKVREINAGWEQHRAQQK